MQIGEFIRHAQPVSDIDTNLSVFKGAHQVTGLRLVLVDEKDFRFTCDSDDTECPVVIVACVLRCATDSIIGKGAALHNCFGKYDPIFAHLKPNLLFRDLKFVLEEADLCHIFMVTVDKHLYIERRALLDVCGHIEPLNHDLRFITRIYWHRVDLYAKTFPAECRVNSVPLRLNTIGDEDDAFIRICGKNTPGSLNGLRDVCRVPYVLVQLQPLFLDFGELQFCIWFTSIAQ